MLNFKAECIGVCVFREQNINRRMDLPCIVHSNGNGQKIFKLNNAKFYGWMHWSVCVSRAEHLQENGFTMCSTEQWKWWVKFLNWFFKVNFKTKLCNVCHLSYWKLIEMIQKCRPSFFFLWYRFNKRILLTGVENHKFVFKLFCTISISNFIA